MKTLKKHPWGVFFFLIILGINSSEIQAQPNFKKFIITNSAIGVGYIRVGDIDGDQDLDVAGTSSDGDFVSWWENDGRLNFTRHDVDTSSPFPNFIVLHDLDQDSDVDMLSCDHQTHKIMWYENDGRQNFMRHDINVLPQPTAVFAIDLDKDQDFDILASAWGQGEGPGVVAWFENDGQEDFKVHILGNQQLEGARFIYPGDLDGDGDLDIVTSCAYRRTSFDWWENDGQQNFTRHNLSTQHDAAQIVVIDLDYDDDPDILHSSTVTHQIIWWENDSRAHFQKHIIAEDFYKAHSVNAADLDLDRDLDVIGSAPSWSTVAWWEKDGHQNFVKHIIDEALPNSIFIVICDLNADNAFDIVTQSPTSHCIVCYLNLLHSPTGIHAENNDQE